MKAASAIGIVIACLAIIGAGIMEGVQIPSLLNIPALMIVLGGTAGAIFAGVGMRRFGRMATPEVAAVCGLPGPTAPAELWRLATGCRPASTSGSPTTRRRRR